MYWLAMHLLQPFTFAFLLTLGSQCVLWRFCRLQRGRLWHSILVFAGLTATCSPGVAFFALSTLERKQALPADIPPSASVIVVLGGTVRLSDDGSDQMQLASDSVERCIRAARVYHQRPFSTVVASGGKVSATLPGAPLAQLMRDFLIELGVDEQSIRVEDHSRTTHENAVETRKLFGEQNVPEIVLITEATHLRRAAACFRHEGFKVFPVGCSYRATPPGWSVLSFLPSASAAMDINRAAHEWMGIAWYRLHNRI